MSANKQVTAVEWLYNRLQTEPYLTLEDFEQAKAMEKEQIIDAYLKDRPKAKIGKILTCWDNAEQYYNENYETI